MRRSADVAGSLVASASANHDFDFRQYGGRVGFTGIRASVNVTANDKAGAGAIDLIPLTDVNGVMTPEAVVAGTVAITAGAAGLYAAVAEADGATVVHDGVRVRVTAGTGGTVAMTYNKIELDLTSTDLTA